MNVYRTHLQEEEADLLGQLAHLQLEQEQSFELSHDLQSSPHLFVIAKII